MLYLADLLTPTQRYAREASDLSALAEEIVADCPDLDELEALNCALLVHDGLIAYADAYNELVVRQWSQALANRLRH